MLEPMRPEDSAEAYHLLVSRVEDLIAKGIGQYTEPYPPKQIFDERVGRGENWLVRQDGRIAGIVSIIENGVGDEWDEIPYPKEHLWIASLFVAQEFKRMGVGDLILAECQARSRSAGLPLLLDCYLDSGFLENFYAKRGFTTLGITTFVLGHRSFHAALMQSPGGTL